MPRDLNANECEHVEKVSNLDRKLTVKLMKLEPCKPYLKSKKSRRLRKNKWVPDV
jgi:hypothetical protein